MLFSWVELPAHIECLDSLVVCQGGCFTVQDNATTLQNRGGMGDIESLVSVLLDKHDAGATFFLIGSHVRAFPALAREITARGHAIGNHTETHPSLIFLSRAKLHEELNRCREAILSAVDGAEPRWVRPPFGFRGPQLDAVVRQLGYSAVAMWSKWAWDWKPQPAQPVIHRLRRVTGGDIVLLHDGDHRLLEGDRRHTVAALAHWLPRWKDAGLRFVTLDAVGNTSR